MTRRAASPTRPAARNLLGVALPASGARPALKALLALSALLVSSAVFSTSGFAEDKSEAKPKAPPGPRYVNKTAGVSARGPTGWKMRADKGGPVEWARLVTFYDPSTDADVVFSVRKKTASSPHALLTKVRKEWRDSTRMRVKAMRAVEASALVKVAHVIVDASYVLKPKPKNGVPSAPVPYSINATYYLGPDGEYLLYAKAQDTHWSRLRPRLRKVRDSIIFSRASAPVPTGGGSFRNTRYGFSCIYPATSSVVVRGLPHLAGFVPASDADATLDVYRISFDGSIDDDARRLITHYVEDQGGEAERSDTTVAGKEAALVSAKAEIGGVERTIRIATFKRNDGKTWRLRVTGPADQDVMVDAALKTFIDGFKLIRAQ